MSRLVGQRFRLAHANIKGTPKMRAEYVRSDLEVLAERAGILALVEFRWSYYWTILGRVLKMTVAGDRRSSGPRWRTFPGLARGIAAPVVGGQMFAWKADAWKRLKAKSWVLHLGAAAISETRWIRAVVLADRSVELALRMTLLVTHNVVGGDNRSDADRREGILATDIDRIVKAVKWAKRRGHPVVLMLDANIRASSDIYATFIRRVVAELGGEIVGREDGVEYVIVYQGENGTRFVVDGTFEVQPKAHGGPLNTDHEVRGVTGHLERAAA